MLIFSKPRRCRLLKHKGKENFNWGTQALMKRHNIKFLSSESEQNTTVVKQFHRTIKTKISTYLSDRCTVR